MPGEHNSNGQLAAAISNSVVHSIAETTGRGPTRARTTIGQDAIFVVVQDTLTRGERALVDAGDRDTVVLMRAAWQRVMHESLNRDIEHLTGRRVIGFMSTNHIDPDLGVEVFILEPGNGDARTLEADSDL